MRRGCTETDPTGGGTTTYGYDIAGRMTSLTDPDSNITTWTYTHANEVATEVNPLGHPTTYSYDLNGKVTSVIDPNAHQITYSYDADNEETGETWVHPGGGSALNIVTVSYDADGDIAQIKDANTNYQYTYNADDEVSTFADNGTTGLPLVTLTYGYDGDGNVTSDSDSLGGLLTLTYNARDELTNEKFTATRPFRRGGHVRVRQRRPPYRHDPLFQRRRDDQGRRHGIFIRSCQQDDGHRRFEFNRYDARKLWLYVRRCRSSFAGSTNVGFGRLVRYGDLLVHEQQPVDRRDALERLVLKRELHLGQQRQ